MLARLGNVLYWLGSALSILTLLIIPFGGAFGLRYPFRTDDIVYIVFVIIVAGLIWVVGRACRYVLAGT
jgi:hypothetical protein